MNGALNGKILIETTISYIRNKTKGRYFVITILSPVQEYTLIITMNIRYPPNNVFPYVFWEMASLFCKLIPKKENLANTNRDLKE